MSLRISTDATAARWAQPGTMLSAAAAPAPPYSPDSLAAYSALLHANGSQQVGTLWEGGSDGCVVSGHDGAGIWVAFFQECQQCLCGQGPSCAIWLSWTPIPPRLKTTDDERGVTGPSCESHGIHCIAGRGAIRDSSLGLTEALWVGPEDRGVYIGSPSVWRTEAGPVLATHDFFGAANQDSTLNSTVQVLIELSGRGDAGVWQHTGNVSGICASPSPLLLLDLALLRTTKPGTAKALKLCARTVADWANIFAHPLAPEQLFLLGVSSGAPHARRNIVISRSRDMGSSWSAPATLFEATAESGSYHCAPTPSLVAADGRIYRAFEATEPGPGHKGLAALVISTVAPVTKETDLTDPAVWRRSTSVVPDVESQASLESLGWDKSAPWTWEEGNAVEMANGSVANIIRIDGQTNSSGTHNRAAVLRLDKAGAELTFDRMIEFPACSSKFTIRRDPSSGLFITLSTDVTASAVAQDTVFARNHLVLAVSANLYDWSTCSTLLMDDTGLTAVDSARYTGVSSPTLPPGLWPLADTHATDCI